MAYQLAIPYNLKVHNVFHISVLKKYVHDASHVIYWNVVQVEPKGEILVEPDCILGRSENYSAKTHNWTGEGAMEAP